MTIQSVLLAGGYGVVGAEVARLIRQNYPDINILLGGRNPGSGDDLAKQLGNAITVHVDSTDEDPLADLKKLPDVVLAVVNDPNDQLLLSSVRRGIPYIDVTRWTERLRRAIQRVKDAEDVRAPVVFSSSWMAGVAATLAAGYARTFSSIEQIDIGILYATKDRAGPNSVEYMDRIHLPFEVFDGGEPTMVKPFQKAHRTNFPQTGSFNLYRFDTPDQFTLPRVTGARGVAARIGFDDSLSGALLSALVRLGIWKMISGDAFRGLRHGMLFNPGEGAPHRIRIDIDGVTERAVQEQHSWLITDPESQTHMTALGALIQFDRLVNSQESVENGVQISEEVTHLDHCLTMLKANSVEVSKIT